MAYLRSVRRSAAKFVTAKQTVAPYDDVFTTSQEELLQSVGKSGGASPSSSPVEEVAPQRFSGGVWIKVSKPDGSKLGLDIGVDSDEGLCIKRVHQGGLVASWNETHPTLAVGPGDVIVEVVLTEMNCMARGRADSRLMMEWMKVAENLQLKVEYRPDVPKGTIKEWF